MVSTLRQQRILRGHGTGMRLMALFVGFWMVMLPQMLNARALSTPDEYGSRPAPVNEEEEIKHLNILDLLVVGKEQRKAIDQTPWTRYCKDRPLVVPHGDVPHPPPWHRVR